MNAFHTIARCYALTAAFALASAAAPAAAAQKSPTAANPADPTLLAALAQAGTLGAQHLDPAIDHALGGISVTKTAEPAALKAHSSHTAPATLGIGHLGHGLADTVAYAQPYAKSGSTAHLMLSAAAQKRAEPVFAAATDGVSACYGQPMIGEMAKSDRYAAGVSIDATGHVLAVHTIIPSRHGQAGMDDCVARVLRAQHFPAGLGRGELVYAWSFQLKRGTFRFN